MSLTSSLTYLTPELPGIGGQLKQRPEDFLVEEAPAYEPCGEGEHAYLFIEKTGLTTFDAIRRIAKAFNVRKSDVGYAGLKDKHAVTRQWFSVRPPKREKLDDYVRDIEHHPQMKVLLRDYHGNKLRRGHLVGNRFVIKVRGVEATAAIVAKKTLDRLAAAGIPNFIGEQRFGYRQNGHLLGRMLLLGDHAGFLREMLGDPREGDAPILLEARQRFDAGDYDEALRLWPRQLRYDRQALDAVRQGKPPRDAVMAVDPAQRELLVAGLQSAVFNAVLDLRLRDPAGGAGIDRLEPGDLAFKHDSGAVFAVDEATAAAENGPDGRVPRLEVSPSGPMWGAEMMRASGPVDERELGALRSFGIDLPHLSEASRYGAQGKRRPLRVPLTDPEVAGGVDEHGSYVRLAFQLPRGSYATIALREIMKIDPPADLGEEG